MAINLPPFLVFFLFALAIALTAGGLRRVLTLLAPIASFSVMLQLPDQYVVAFTAMNLELILHQADRLSLLFGYLFHIAALIGAIFALHLEDRTQAVASTVYAGSALGAVFAGDLLTLFLFWEMLALSSVFLIFARGTQRSIRAGLRYLVFQVLSGVLLLAGVIVLYQQTNDIRFTALSLDGWAGRLILIAFGIKAAFPFLHTWLTDAYPEATPTGTVFLSAFTTKVAVYALARGYPGTELLVYIGAAMTCFPIFYAVIENDLRRVLAYSMINQIGFMVCGIGIGTELAINGAVAHAFNDVIFKGLLMMSMGAVLWRTGKMNGSDLGGLFKSMPKTATLCIVGAASISAFPLFSGFVSKSIVMVAVLKEGHPIIWLMLLFASAGVFHHAGIKIPFFAFFAHDSGIRCQEAPTNMLIAMLVSAILCIGIGCYPQLLYQHLPFPMDYSPYDVTHVLAQIQLLFFSALAFVWLKLAGLYPPELRSTNIDSEWIYRFAGFRIYEALRSKLSSSWATFTSLLIKANVRLIRELERGYGRQSAFAQTWTTTPMIFVTLCVFAAILVFAFVR